ncbi:MAG: hypothetical protein HRF50_01580 [Phycisphaerae bacterium]|jgi:hypothetical protein
MDSAGIFSALGWKYCALPTSVPGASQHALNRVLAHSRFFNDHRATSE